MSACSLTPAHHLGRPVRIEHTWVGPDRSAGAPVIVFLHEGLGSVAMWRDFPERLCRAAGLSGLVFSRYGYGQSTPRLPDEAWLPDFMHIQAHDDVPGFLRAVGLWDSPHPIWLFGHSDGASIALLMAARYPDRIAGAVVVAPHVFVEDLTITSIAAICDRYPHSDLPQRLSRYHADPDSAFWGWGHAWLRPAFRAWNIESELEAIRCPVLAAQGLDDEYGTLAQIDAIVQRVPRAERFTLAECGHSPHKDQPDALIAKVTGWLTAARTPPA